MNEKVNKRVALIAFIALIVVSGFLRFYHLSQPNAVVFDEVYFPVFANNYLTHTDFFDSHPPLGKLIIAGGIATFGNNPIGWRVMNAAAGVLLLVVIGGFVYDITRRPLPALLATYLVAIDPMALVESRIGLINIYLGLFSLVGLWFFWRWHRRPRDTVSFMIALLAFAAAGSVKWIGFGAFGAAVCASFVMPSIRKQLRWPLIVLAITIPIIVYFATFVPDLWLRYDGINQKGWEYLTWWHKGAFGYHAHLTATHPYGSDWWTWPFSIRPLWLYFQSLPSHHIAGIIEPGNLITWIGGLVALVYACFTFLGRPKEDQPERSFLGFLILAYFILFLPWAAIGRVKFIYHYFIPVLVLSIISALMLERLYRRSELKLFGHLFLIAGGAFFIFFLPLLLGTPVSETFYHWHIWLKSWI